MEFSPVNVKKPPTLKSNAKQIENRVEISPNQCNDLNVKHKHFTYALHSSMLLFMLTNFSLDEFKYLQLPTVRN